MENLKAQLAVLPESVVQGIQKLSHRHQGIIVWLISNPHRKLGDCANDLGYTQAWLSRIVHSDLFQAEYQELCAKMGEVAVHSTVARLGELAHMAMDRTEDILRSPGPAPQFVLGVMNSTLDKLGYLPKSKDKIPQEHVHFHINAEDLARAREHAAQVHSRPIEINARAVAEPIFEELDA